MEIINLPAASCTLPRQAATPHGVNRSVPLMPTIPRTNKANEWDSSLWASGDHGRRVQILGLRVVIASFAVVMFY